MIKFYDYNPYGDVYYLKGYLSLASVVSVEVHDDEDKCYMWVSSSIGGTVMMPPSDGAKKVAEWRAQQ